jgi:N-acetylglucosaminyl-diphospho-decaprenol L-rhamnosyltransferase
MSATDRNHIWVTAASGEAGHAACEHVDCVIVVVTYNSARHVGKLLDSLPAATAGLSTRCLVVDNDSSDETMRIVCSRDDVLAVEAGANLGYSGGINIGRAMAGSCSSLLILNPDVVLEPGAVARLYEALDQPGVGVAVPMFLRDDGSVYPSMRREPSLTRAFGDALLGAYWSSRPGWLSTTIWDEKYYQEPRDVEWAAGTVMLVSRECDEAVGSWDDARFFLYAEETDFAARARSCGYRIRYLPMARAHHAEGGSGRSPALAALCAVNWVRYYEKYHSRPATSVYRAVVAFDHLLRSVARPRDPGHRAALRMLTRRSRWRDLPGGEAPSRHR